MPLFVRRNDTEEIIQVWKYTINDELEESIWSKAWYGRHVIGQDCEWAVLNNCRIVTNTPDIILKESDTDITIALPKDTIGRVFKIFNKSGKPVIIDGISIFNPDDVKDLDI